MSIHLAGVVGLVLIFLIGAIRPINIGILALVMTFLVGGLLKGEGVREIGGGFPIDLLILLVGVTYLFAIAESNGTVERIVLGSARFVERKRAVIPWMVFAMAALPPMAGALGSAGVALLAPLSLRLAERYDIDRRMIGLMVAHGASSGNFSPLNVLSAIVLDAVKRQGLDVSATTLFVSNLVYNLVLAVIIYVAFGGLRLSRENPTPKESGVAAEPARSSGVGLDQWCSVGALFVVAVLGIGFGLNIGLVALTAGALLHLVFPKSSAGADRKIAWDVVLLVSGIVTYVAALQRHGTVDAVGTQIAGLGSALLSAFLLCAVGAVTSAFASSAGILGALVPLAVPLMARGEIGATGLVVALAVSATVVDATPFSTVGALVVANARDDERSHVYRSLLVWGAIMVITAPPLTWLLFIVW